MKKKVRTILLYIKNFFLSLRPIKETELNYKYIIHPTWDSFPHPYNSPDYNFFYSGREAYINKLSHWLIHSGGGSILISGVRGVGKTAFVYYAIHRARELLLKNKKSKKEIHFIPINASSCLSDAEGNNSLNIVKELIKGCLYEQKASGSIENLYLSSISNGSHREKEENKETSEKMQKYELISQGKFNVLAFILFMVHLVSSFLVKIEQLPKILQFPVMVSRKILDYQLTGVIFLVVIAFNYLFRFTMKRSSNRSKTTDIEINSQNVDFLILNLRKYLEEAKDQIYVFVVDEVDKIDVTSKFEKLISDIKNLITISSGRFLFITDDRKFFDIRDRKTTEDPHPKSSTYFNWKLFVPQIDIDDLKKYLTQISLVPVDAKKIEEFAYFLYANSGGVFTEIKHHLRDFLIYENGHAVLDLSPKTFGEDHIKVARLTKIYYQVIKKYDSPVDSRQDINHCRKEICHSIFRRLIDEGSLQSKPIWQILQEFDSTYYGKLSKADQLLLMDEVLEIFKDINLKADRIKPLSNILSDNTVTDNLTFVVDLSQVSIGLDDIEKDSKTTTEMKLEAEIEDFNKVLSQTSQKLLIPDPEDILQYVSVDAKATYEAIMSFNDSLQKDKPTDQSLVNEKLISLRELVKNQKNNTLRVIGEYLVDKLHNKIFYEIIQISKLKVALKGKNAEVIIEAEPIPNGFNNLIKRRSINKDSLLFKSDNPYQTITKLVHETNRKLGVFPEFKLIKNWQAKSLDENGTWRYSVLDLIKDKKNPFDSLHFTFSCKDDYWRFGMALGCTLDSIQPIGSSKYSLFHFYKDHNSPLIKYKRCGRPELAESIPDIDVIAEPSDKKFYIYCRVIQNKLRIYYNEKLVDEFSIDPKDTQSSFLLAWADQYDLSANFESIWLKTQSVESLKSLPKKKNINRQLSLTLKEDLKITDQNLT